MSEMIRRTHRWLVALVVLAALTIGARQLMATPVNLECQTNGGTCGSQAECEDNCDLLFPQGYEFAFCGPMGCCNCVL